MGTILIIILVLLLLGALPTWPYSGSWGYYPSGGLGLVLLIVVILALTAGSDPQVTVGLGRWARENRSFVTLLRVTFHQALGHNDQCQNLGPL